MKGPPQPTPPLEYQAHTVPDLLHRPKSRDEINPRIIQDMDGLVTRGAALFVWSCQRTRPGVFPRCYPLPFR
jgi:hypothetical protein